MNKCFVCGGRVDAIGRCIDWNIFRSECEPTIIRTEHPEKYAQAMMAGCMPHSCTNSPEEGGSMNRDSIWIAITKRLPRTLVYWCAIKVWAEATTGEYGSTDVTSITFADALKRWK